MQLSLLDVWERHAALKLHVAEREMVTHSLIPPMVLVPVDSEGKPVEELLVRSILYEHDKARPKRDWSMPYHR
jgi:hypothetical protein